MSHFNVLVKTHARGERAVHVRLWLCFVAITIDVEREKTLAKIRLEVYKRSSCNLEGHLYR